VGAIKRSKEQLARCVDRSSWPDETMDLKNCRATNGVSIVFLLTAAAVEWEYLT